MVYFFTDTNEGDSFFDFIIVEEASWIEWDGTIILTRSSGSDKLIFELR